MKNAARIVNRIALYNMIPWLYLFYYVIWDLLLLWLF
jgi:hypothetical protein